MSHRRSSSLANTSTFGRTSTRSAAQSGTYSDTGRRTTRKAGHSRQNRPLLARPTRASWSLSAQRQKALLASGAAATLMVAIVLPDRVSSEAIAQSDCQQVIQSGAEMSRGELSTLIALPVGSSKQAVYQTVSEPYCTLPTETAAAEKAGQSAPEREAYPLAFDPAVWLVLNYEAGNYVGYDFAFKQ